MASNLCIMDVNIVIFLTCTGGYTTYEDHTFTTTRYRCKPSDYGMHAVRWRMEP
ncbi:hypothetical protein [Paenibacillus glacialis]|uniref:hypothetical protein n=1 Tax=Paenibacillus glacialis TaxID=494026 RepID=UPI001B805CE5|nr:hypothetical protein [Paenibacillus glacialis]